VVGWSRLIAGPTSIVFLELPSADTASQPALSINFFRSKLTNPRLA
jgi:hypothetical protein